MITVGSNGQRISYGIKHYNIDSMDDLSKLNPKAEIMGTTCFVINKSKYFMINGEKEWVEIAPFGSSSSSNGGSGSNPDSGTNPDDPSNPDNNNPSNPDDGNEDIYDGGEV